jgi:hypothetical protein
MPLFADRIHLTTGVVIKGRILKVNDASVEYDPDGDRPFDIVSRRLVRRIVYDDGSVVEMMGTEEKAPMDDAAADSHKDSISGNEPSESDVKPEVKSASESGRERFCIVEFGTGWNSYTGIFGARLEFPLADCFSLNAGLGYGLWGYRLSAGMRYYFQDVMEGPGIGLGAACNTGLGELTMDNVETSGGVKRDVTVRTDPASTVNLTLLYAFQLSLNIKLQLEAGYSFPLSSDNYKCYDSYTGNKVRLSGSDADMLDVIQPGGIILALGVCASL